MAVPKRKTGRSKTRSRRAANTKVQTMQTCICPQCGAATLPHRVGPTCGTSTGRQVIAVD